MRSGIAGAAELDGVERVTLAELAKKLGRKVLKEIATIASPDSMFDLSRCAA